MFLDLDECEQEVLALGKIVTIQDTMLKSKIDLLAMYKNKMSTTKIKISINSIN